MTNTELNSELLLMAYAQGFFPMPNPDGTIAWYHPDPRAILPLEKFHLSRSLRRTLRRKEFHLTFNRDFSAVIAACSDRDDTWIDQQMQNAYMDLHRIGAAHSVEIRRQEKLIGGLYGVSLGGAFFAESKFHYETDASKIAVYALVEAMKRQKMILLEVQFMTEHLRSLGAIEISRQEYLVRLQQALELEVTFPPKTFPVSV